MGIFDTIISAAKEGGVLAFYLPFLIAFALIYGLLNRAQIFGDASKDRKVNAINAIIAFGIAFYVISFTSVGVTVTNFFGTFFSQSTMLLVTVVVVTLIVSVLSGIWPGGKWTLTEKGEKVYLEGKPGVGKLIFVIAALGLLAVFFNSGGGTILGVGGTSPALGTLSAQDMLIIAFIVITVLLIYWVTKGEKKE